MTLLIWNMGSGQWGLVSQNLRDKQYIIYVFIHKWVPDLHSEKSLEDQKPSVLL